MTALVLGLLSLLAYAGLRQRVLTVGGALAGPLFGIIVFSAFGARGLLLVILFASVGSAISRLPGAVSHEPRSARHASANLGVPVLLAIAFLLAPDLAPWHAGCAASLAAVLSDTAATEIGTRYGGTPRSILTGRFVTSGTDGGVTWAGSLAGVSGSVFMAIVAGLSGLVPAGEVVFVAVSGFAGSVCDSLFGATFERHGLLGNHGVNFLSAAAAAAFMLLRG